MTSAEQFAWQALYAFLQGPRAWARYRRGREQAASDDLQRAHEMVAERAKVVA